MDKIKNQINLEINNNNGRKAMKSNDEMNQKNSLNKEKKNRGFVRFFRGIIKKKEQQRKDIISNKFRKWIKQSLKGSKVKKIVMVRISISREKDQRVNHKNKFQFDKENEKEKSKSVNKKIVKSISKYHEKQNNIKTEKINKINNQLNYKKNQNNQNKKIKNINIINNKELNIINNYGTIDNERAINSNKMNLKYKNNQIIEISDIKKKPNSKINNKDKVNYIYPKINLKNQFNQLDYSSKNNPNQTLTYDNISIVYTSSTKKDKNNNLSNTNIKLNNLNNSKINPILNEKSSKKGNFIKYNYYNDSKINKYTTLPIKKVKIDLIDNNDIKKQNNPYEKNKNKTYKNDLSNNNSFNQRNISENNIYKINNYSNINNRQINRNKSEINGKYSNTTRKNSNPNYSKYSQKIGKPTLKNEGATVIQLYSGRKK